MNKTSVTALVIGLIAIVFSGYNLLFPAQYKLGSYTPPVFSSSGYVQVLATSTNLPVLCALTNIQYLGTTGNVTGTLPAATTTFATCPTLQNSGATILGQIVNDSTNTVVIAAGSGDIIKCETQAIGTTTYPGGNVCSATSFSMPASTTLQTISYFDGSSSTLKVESENMTY